MFGYAKPQALQALRDTRGDHLRAWDLLRAAGAPSHPPLQGHGPAGECLSDAAGQGRQSDEPEPLSEPGRVRRTKRCRSGRDEAQRVHSGRGRCAGAGHAVVPRPKRRRVALQDRGQERQDSPAGRRRTRGAESPAGAGGPMVAPGADVVGSLPLSFKRQLRRRFGV